MLKEYLQGVFEVGKQGDAREESYYSTLEALLKALNDPICRFQGKGDNRVEKQTHSPKEKRVYINKTQYFEGVEPEVWEYQIGGYQVLDKWLKDRKKRILSLEDIKHYCRVVTALAKTIEIQGEIETLYSEIEKNIIPLQSTHG